MITSVYDIWGFFNSVGCFSNIRVKVEIILGSMMSLNFALMQYVVICRFYEMKCIKMGWKMRSKLPTHVECIEHKCWRIRELENPMSIMTFKVKGLCNLFTRTLFKEIFLENEILVLNTL